MNVYILKLASPDTKFNENTCTEANNIDEAVVNLLGPKIEGRRIVENTPYLWSIYFFDKHIADVLSVDKNDLNEVVEARKTPARKSNRFSYVKYDETAMTLQQQMREAVEHAEALVESIPAISNPYPVARYKALALTALEEAYAWMGKAVRDDQINRTNIVDEQPERNNE